MSSYYGPELMHYGIEGMRWGIRRYQPYPKGYTGQGKFTGEGRKASLLDRQHGVYDARIYQRLLNAEHLKGDMKQLKTARKAGQIDDATYKFEKKRVKQMAKESDKYVKSNAFKDEVLDRAKSATYQGMVQEYVDRIFDQLDETTAKAVMTSSQFVTARAGTAQLVGQMLGGPIGGVAAMAIAAKTSKTPAPDPNRPPSNTLYVRI